MKSGTTTDLNRVGVMTGDRSAQSKKKWPVGEREKKIADLYKSGESIQAISEQFGLTYVRTCQLLNKHYRALEIGVKLSDFVPVDEISLKQRREIKRANSRVKVANLLERLGSIIGPHFNV